MTAHTFRIGPLTHYADLADMRTWLEAAQPGHRLIYATGPALGTHPAAKLARDWHAAEMVHLFAPRSKTRANCFDYMVEKRERIVTHRPASGFPPAGSRWATSAEGRIYGLLCEIADSKQPCPTNEVIAAELDLPDRYFVKYRFNRLVEMGLIKVIEPARFSTRVIEIVATRARTAPSEGLRA